MSFTEATELLNEFVKKSASAPYLEFIIGIVFLSVDVLGPWFHMIPFETVLHHGIWPVVAALIGMRICQAVEKTSRFGNYGEKTSLTAA